MNKNRSTPMALAAATAAALLAGCSFIPTYERPQPPVPATYAAGAATTDSAAAQAGATVPWQNYFAEPRLQQLIDIALVEAAIVAVGPVGRSNETDLLVVADHLGAHARG